MHIIAGLGLGLILLYFWLLGHWFARVVVFLLLAAYAALWGALGEYSHGLLIFLAGAGVSWFAAGLPMYWRRRTVSDASLELSLR